MNVHSDYMLNRSPRSITVTECLTELCSRGFHEFMTDSPGAQGQYTAAQHGARERERQRDKEKEKNQSRPTTQCKRRPEERRNKTSRTKGATQARRRTGARNRQRGPPQVMTVGLVALQSTQHFFSCGPCALHSPCNVSLTAANGRRSQGHSQAKAPFTVASRVPLGLAPMGTLISR